VKSLQRETLNSRAVKIPRHANVYTCGDQDEMVYFIESGQIKLLMLSPEGKECLHTIQSTATEIFSVSYAYPVQAHVWKQPPR
jgi:hypothetical protein